jgi:hypothetical protein
VPVVPEYGFDRGVGHDLRTIAIEVGDRNLAAIWPLLRHRATMAWR